MKYFSQIMCLNLETIPKKLFNLLFQLFLDMIITSFNIKMNEYYVKIPIAQFPKWYVLWMYFLCMGNKNALLDSVQCHMKRALKVFQLNLTL